MGTAIETIVMINIPGVFISKDRDMGMRVSLKECSYNKAHNFNMLR
jgi:hypothetical protein